MKTLDQTQLETLAIKHLAFDADFTIKERGRASLDFHDVGVVGLERLMQAGYELGQESAGEPVPEYKNLPSNAAEKYATQINAFNDIGATATEVGQAYRMRFADTVDFEGKPYALRFFFVDGNWAPYLDSEDRQTLALTIENMIRNGVN